MRSNEGSYEPEGSVARQWDSSSRSPPPLTCGASPTSSSTSWPTRSGSSSSTPCRVTGGHLGSNLGAVELTLAVHRVFDSPDDIVLWDTGHQAYVHKIVTGRRDDFGGLRQAGGLSGYPCRAESEHDWVENSHASTILSYAHGIATALDVRRHRPAGRGRHRRRVDDRRHGVRGAQQPRRHRAPVRHHPQRQRPVVRADVVEARRVAGQAALGSPLGAQPGPARAA